MENLRERDKSKELGVGGKIIVQWLLIRSPRRAWIGFIWLRIETSSWLLLTPY